MCHCLLCLLQPLEHFSVGSLVSLKLSRAVTSDRVEPLKVTSFINTCSIRMTIKRTIRCRLTEIKPEFYWYFTGLLPGVASLINPFVYSLYSQSFRRRIIRMTRRSPRHGRYAAVESELSRNNGYIGLVPFKVLTFSF